MALRNTILLVGIFGIFFAFAFPLAPTPILVCKAFLLVLLVRALNLICRHEIGPAMGARNPVPAVVSASDSPPQRSRAVLLC